MGSNKQFVPSLIAELGNGTEVVPESQAEQDWLASVNNQNYSDEQKDRLAKVGTLFAPTTFDGNFDVNKRESYPKDLDPQIRQMIRES